MPDDSSNILISVDDRHVQKMLGGTKKVELRRRVVPVKAGSLIWIYSKIPVGQLTACGVVQQVFEGPPANIWKCYGAVSGITKSEFDHYFTGSSKGCAIIFESVREPENKISLTEIREASGRFHPPQFFRYLYADSPELELFQNCFA